MRFAIGSKSTTGFSLLSMLFLKNQAPQQQENSEEGLTEEGNEEIKSERISGTEGRKSNQSSRPPAKNI